jgi:hypothetical protein
MPSPSASLFRAKRLRAAPVEASAQREQCAGCSLPASQRALRAAPILFALLSIMPFTSSARIEFKDVTADSGLSHFTAYGEVLMNELLDLPCPQEAISFQQNLGNGAGVGDYDGDGDLDVYFTGNQGTTNRLYRNNLEGSDGLPGTFTDVTRDAFQLGEGQEHDLGISRVANFVDLDNDGDLDLVVVNDDDINIGAEDPTYAPSRIFRNEGVSESGVTFSDVTAGSGFRPHGYVHAGVAIADYDGDGLLDIYVTVWNGTGIPRDGGAIFPGSNQLYRNLGAFRFEDVTQSVGLGIVAESSFSAVFHDLDDDGDVDLYVAVDGEEELVFINDAGTYSDQRREVGISHTAADMGIAIADYDNDDDLDFYVTNISFTPNESGDRVNPLWNNLRPELEHLAYEDVARDKEITDTYWGWGTEWADLDNDSDLDLLAVTGFDGQNEECLKNPELAYVYKTPSVLYEADNGTFGRDEETAFSDERVHDEQILVDDSRTLIAFDYDRDGDEDLLVTNVDQPALLLENTSTHSNHYLHLRLEPDYCAVGATVRASVGAVNLRRDVVLGDSYLAGTPTEVHFGLGGDEVVDQLEVEWADGRIDVFKDTPADQTLDISCLPEPDASILTLGSLSTLTCLARARRRAAQTLHPR